MTFLNKRAQAIDGISLTEVDVQPFGNLLSPPFQQHPFNDDFSICDLITGFPLLILTLSLESFVGSSESISNKDILTSPSMPQALSTTKPLRRYAFGAGPTLEFVLTKHLQLIKQLSATPKIPAQGAADVAQEVLDPQAALRANKEVFFFRLVCFHATCSLSKLGANSSQQEREIEKVNAFYLQKEAEVRGRDCLLDDIACS